MLKASKLYEDFGDLVAAADAAAHASTGLRAQGKRGGALTAVSIAERLASECEGADTPALRAARSPITLTARQREVLTLAQAGHSNIEIADILAVSVRTVEGHIYRAAQKCSIGSREALIDLIFGGRCSRSE